MSKFNVLVPKWHLAYFVPIDGHFGQFVRSLDMDFKFVFPSIYINFDTQTNFEVNQTQISHSIPKNTPKNHQSGHISKLHFAQVSFTKKPTPPAFFDEFD